MGDVGRMSLLRHGVELPGLICTAERFGLAPRIARDTPRAVARRKTSGNS